MSLKGLAYFPLYSRNDNVSRNRYKFPILIITYTVFIYLLSNTSLIKKVLSIVEKLCLN